MSYDEIIKKWWAGKFPDADPPKWNSAITCADASDLLRWYDALPTAEEMLRQAMRRAAGGGTQNPSVKSRAASGAELAEKGQP